MASSIKAHRAVAAGISGGLGIALPFAAVAATVPFAEANELVRADVLPVAVGALAGVGLFTLVDVLLDRREARLDAEAEEVASFTSVFSGAEAAHPHATAPSMVEEAATRTARGAARSRRAAPKGVPVISRAVDALDEAAAWAEIDAMLNDDSPISCDPARSKDMYEIALEELRRAERAQAASAPSAAASASVANSSAAQVPVSVHPESTAVFMALANAAMPAASASRAQMASQSAVPADLDLDEAEEASARDAAMASLYGSAANAPKAPAAQPIAVLSADAAATGQMRTAAPVPVADYSGHENMWAAAIAILREEVPSATGSLAVPSDRAASLAQTAHVAPDRMALVAEGGNATRDHVHVNAILEEEFDKVPSSSVRRTSHEYLRVIQGGTASMPRLQAQA